MRKKTGALLAIGMLCTLLAGCGKVDGTQAAITVNGEAVRLGTATYDLRYQQAETMSTMQMYGLTSAGATFWDQEISAEEGEETRTYGDSVKESVQESLVQMVLLRQHAADYGVEIPEAVLTAAANAAKESFSKNEALLAPVGVSEDDIREVMELSAYASLLYDPMTADVDTEVSDEEAKQTTIRYARLSKETAAEEETAETEETAEAEEATEAEEAAADPQATMEEYLKALQAEEDPAAADMEALGTGINEAIFSYAHTYGADDNSLPEEVLTAAGTLQDGQVYDGVIEGSDDYLYVIRMEALFDKEATESKKESIVGTRKQDAYYALLDEWKEASEITTTEAWDKLKLTDSENWTVKAS